MHEVSLVDSIVTQVSELAQQESFKKVSRLRLEVGAMSGVIPESIEFCFPELSQGSPLENALLVINRTPLRVRCIQCSAETEPEIHDIECKKCNSREVKIIAGKDFKIIDLEVE